MKAELFDDGFSCVLDLDSPMAGRIAREAREKRFEAAKTLSYDSGLSADGNLNAWLAEANGQSIADILSTVDGSDINVTRLLVEDVLRRRGLGGTLIDQFIADCRNRFGAEGCKINFDLPEQHIDYVRRRLKGKGELTDNRGKDDCGDSSWTFIPNTSETGVE
jgi:GNAT superfamily N-acetyltransferase